MAWRGKRDGCVARLWVVSVDVCGACVWRGCGYECGCVSVGVCGEGMDMSAGV